MKNNKQDTNKMIDELVETMGMLSDAMSEQMQDHAKMMKMAQTNQEMTGETIATITKIANEIAQLKIQFKVVDLKLLEICNQLNIEYKPLENYENINQIKKETNI